MDGKRRRCFHSERSRAVVDAHYYILTLEVPFSANSMRSLSRNSISLNTGFGLSSFFLFAEINGEKWRFASGNGESARASHSEPGAGGEGAKMTTRTIIVII